MAIHKKRMAIWTDLQGSHIEYLCTVPSDDPFLAYTHSFMHPKISD
jgi:hypothetical protein